MFSLWIHSVVCVGEFCFKGIGEEGDVEIGYGIDVVVAGVYPFFERQNASHPDK